MKNSKKFVIFLVLISLFVFSASFANAEETSEKKFKLGDYIKTADFKVEKHIPVLSMPAKVKAGELFEIKADIGKVIPHPNTPDHFISWIQFFYKPADGKFLVDLGKCYFASHSESLKPEVPGIASTEPFCSMKVKLAKSGTIFAVSYCKGHGLWETSQEIIVE
ncbi:MAG: Neelaredoxin [Synergistaceae bacterium]|nr:Neelaredoxin [Synergistaceae bacterium]